ncbi:MAG: acireductone synthase [Prochloraceae cyanobacterium]|nr:acireductone synthase [Prochloraceae cyanobacterium]
MNVKAIVNDIEGTTSSLDFVHKVLFPYSAQALPDYIRQHYQEPEIAAIIAEAKEQINKKKCSIDEVIATFLAWIEADKKITPLKTLQGFIWEDGFTKGKFKGHLYEDAYYNLQKWHQQNLKLYVYSSGSEKAQKLLFAHTEYGDLTDIFNGYFDTRIGNKKEASSYEKIAAKIKLKPQEILFLSDVVVELDAASSAGYKTILLAREKMPENTNNHRVVSNFNEI